MEPAGFSSSEGEEGRIRLISGAKEDNSLNFSYVHLSNCSLIVNSNSNRSYSHWKKINTLVFSDTFILNNLLTRKDIFWRP